MRKIRLGIILGLVAVFFCHAISTRELLSSFFENQKKLKSLKARLVVEMKRGENYSYMKLEYVSKGKKVFIKARPPFSFVLVSNGEKAHFYSKQDKTVWLYFPGQYEGELEDPQQQKQEILEDIPDLEKVADKYLGWKKVSVYEGKPTESNEFVSKFRVWVDPDNNFLYRIESFDLHDDLVSRIDFKKYRLINGVWLNLLTRSWNKTEKEVIESSSEFINLTVNGDVDDQLFDFTIPEGVKIKDLTKKIIEEGKKR